MAPPPTRTTTFGTCPLCEAMCGIRIELEEGRVQAIRGDDADPFSQGHICPKAPALKELHEDPDRLKHPLRRVGGRWEPLPWDDALDLAAEGLHRVQREHGRDAMGLYLGNPNAHNLGAMLFGPLMLRALRSKNRFSATSVDQLPHMFASWQMFGHQLFFPVPDLDRTDYFLILGANPLASNGSIMTAPDMRRRLREIRERDGQVVVVDPRRTETAKVASEHLFIRPATDAFFLLALVREVFAQGLVDLGRLADDCDRLDVLEAVAQPYTARRAERVTGIPAATIKRVARELAMAERAAVYGRVGACTQAFGGLNAWLIHALNLITGHFDRPGGVMFTTPAVDVVSAAGGFGIGRGSFGRWKSRVRGLPEFGGELPASCMAEEMLEPGEGQIRGMITMAGNPVLSVPNGARLDEAFASLDFMISIDPYLNETTRHADLILPPVSPLERDHYDLVFHAVAVRNTAKFVPAPLPKPAGAKDDGEILLGLLRRVETLRGGPLSRRALEARALEALGQRGLLDLGLRTGPWGKGIAGWKPAGSGEKGKLSLKVLKAHPHGLDLGPLMPSMPERLPAQHPRIDLAPQCFVDDLPRLDASEGSETSLRLIGRRHVRSNNSWMHNVPQLMKGRDRCTLMMHAADAKKRGVKSGDVVVVRSRVGAVEVVVEVGDEMMEGVVSLPHGFGHHRAGTRMEVAEAHAGVSLNDLTDDGYVDELTGTAAINGVPVEVEARAEAAE
ncbi:MAG TPA: molybdopterin-dependent oxidoreductase [Polyangiaceae bacterium LLY-WYZ-15_(1-7)]|nr:dehydrogenase [Myxococcales bacterium]MAT24222.1 dehydrogenase [Sandaracinus sp.]HJL03727.1 molybdopterin-dependent oxidoreductase [Polyangiaceae bacterium LLY-WYZ-15_(1-7)]HJL08183.1 molybdopterin-dependent oxidoreductase [Polyangiaceae bacterium LLY-WYZ-15_(1-7)]HJL36283.1 molybdopterin-dependent oxidoreductase [Polyangiaceae bacterium LLY-WYZ-15_(1-7)]